MHKPLNVTRYTGDSIVIPASVTFTNMAMRTSLAEIFSARLYPSENLE